MPSHSRVSVPLSLALLTLAAAPGAAHAQESAHAHGHGVDRPCEAPTEADVAGVCEALDHYLQGHATGQAAHAEAAFYEDAKMVWVADGELRERPIREYIAGFSGEPAEDEADRKRWVSDVVITGDAAVGTIVLDYPGARIVDYMTLLRTNGEWRIIHKSFHVERTGS